MYGRVGPPETCLRSQHCVGAPLACGPLTVRGANRALSALLRGRAFVPFPTAT
jgi:hypothetical protein